jgi:hypothetical protein
MNSQKHMVRGGVFDNDSKRNILSERFFIHTPLTPHSYESKSKGGQ